MKLKIFKLVLALAAVVPAIFLHDGWYILFSCLAAFVLGYIAANLLIWLFIIAVALVSMINKNGGHPSAFYGFVLNLGIKQVTSHARIKIKVKGRELIPNEPYLLVCNHRSNFDNFILSTVIGDPSLVFISKPENFKIPIAAPLMRRCGYLAIDRENPRNALKTIHASAELVKNGNARVGVFPEGTRGHESTVAPFSEGCFLVAKKAGCPVLVACLRGTDNIHKRFPRSTTVYLEFLCLIDTESVKESRSGAISETAYAKINDAYVSQNALSSPTSK